ncbi:hypothetical protein Back2_10940 [Nocardioides baekrokdamisoli]|uniref:DUF262 domain-containing protein n=1 Tax=Nocardioides baekrokdamisoli TaxID=1804624 RepID=A0A3G9ICX2_9ACTN|nr:DUF262 domain-containing protein [Nocardioides baekrokdamisoli]BBH16807.1 hypothetical protein Back2_10940 [Nocardioides baekrokdamisoli]
MKAEETLVANLFESKQQVRVPVWQRRYSWDKSDWRDLWDDIVRARDEKRTHFLGSFVFMTHPVSGIPSEAKRFDIVDGQQRTITLFLLVAAIRDAVVALGADEDQRATEFQDYTSQLLMNANLKDGHRERLVLQLFDDPSFAAIVAGDTTTSAESPVTKAYGYFRGVLAPLTRDQLDATLAAILTKLEAVWVTLAENDNAHRVFQTLNAGGKPLRQSDLVRNYFFLLLGEKGASFYETQWSKMESHVSSREIERYFSAWSISQGHSGSTESVFSYFQKDLANHETDSANVLAYGAALIEAATLFSWIRQPNSCPITAAKRALTDLHHWGSLPAEGLVLYLLRRHRAGSLSGDALSDCIHLILSFMARRMLAGYEPNLHKSIFVGVARKLRAEEHLSDADVATYLRLILSSGQDVRTWPNDDAVKHYASQNPIYLKSRQHWVFGVLERLNSSLIKYSKHKPDSLDRNKYQVEHVMPQKLTTEWEGDLTSWGSENATQTHQTLAHVLGNLTLTAINPQLSQKPFGEKKPMLQDDWLKLNSEIALLDEWSEAQIVARSGELAERACAEYPAPYAFDELENVKTHLGLGQVPTLPEEDDQTTDEILLDED